MQLIPFISSLYAGILALFLVGLSFYVIKGRFKNKIGLGDGGNPDMLKRIRMQGNFIEYVPMLLVMMVVMELNGMHAWMLHLYGIGIILTRMATTYGLYTSAGTSLPRFIGGAGTFVLLTIAAIACITRYFI